MISNRMKVLIGTPIHEVKDYSMERWLENVSKLEHPADLLLVDNSPGLDYVKKVKGYCVKYGIKKYEIKHLELPPEQQVFERVARSREVIRQYVLISDYDAWFSWESDQLIPNNSLDVLIKIMESENFQIASHDTWTREDPDLPLDELFGTTLIKREALKKHGFILEFGTDPEMPDTWELSEKWFRKRVLRDGGSSIEAEGVLKPTYHLSE